MTGPTRGTFKQHGYPTEFLWHGSIADRGDGIPATIQWDPNQGQYLVHDESGGLLAGFGRAGRFWAAPIPAEADRD